jgi:hypothetical protein
MADFQPNWNTPEPFRQTAAAILGKVRFKINDTTLNRYSDTEMLIALNEGIHLLWDALSSHYSTLTRKVKGYSTDQTGRLQAQLLPEDFVTLVSMEYDTGQHNGYDRDFYGKRLSAGWSQPRVSHDRFPRIEGEHILYDAPVKLVYNYVPREVSLMKETVDVPDSLTPDIVAITANIITQNMDGARARAGEAGVKFSQKREYATPPMMKAFP